MSLIQRCPQFRGGGGGGVIPLCFHYRELVSLYTEVSSFQGVGIDKFHCIQLSPHFNGLE